MFICPSLLNMAFLCMTPVLFYFNIYSSYVYFYTVCLICFFYVDCDVLCHCFRAGEDRERLLRNRSGVWGCVCHVTIDFRMFDGYWSIGSSLGKMDLIAYSLFRPIKANLHYFEKLWHTTHWTEMKEGLSWTSFIKSDFSQKLII